MSNKAAVDKSKPNFPWTPRQRRARKSNRHTRKQNRSAQFKARLRKARGKGKA